jgi:dihydroxy-acid dehydratase
VSQEDGATGELRSRAWWDDSDNPEMTALYLERFLNYGLTAAELQSGRPIIGIAQTGNDLVPCNRHHLALADWSRSSTDSRSTAWSCRRAVTRPPPRA